MSATADVPHPTNISLSGDEVWVSGGGGLLRMSLQPLVLYPGLTAGLTAGPEGYVELPPVRFPRPDLPLTRSISARESR